MHLDGSWETKTYLRVHEGDRVADREVARRMLGDAQPDHDAQVLDGYTEAGLHAESVRQYRQLLASRRPDHPFLREDDPGFMRQIGALGRDRLRRDAPQAAPGEPVATGVGGRSSGLAVEDLLSETVVAAIADQYLPTATIERVPP